MSDLGHLIGHWGYVAIFVLVVLGNMGIPFPEETVLLLAGYMVWQGDLRLSLVLCVGVVSAVIGDNIGFWIGRKYGQGTVERYEIYLLGSAHRVARARGFVARYGPLGVFVARFLPGLRFMAGPLAGATGLRPFPFLLANVAGAVVYVPATVGLGYAVGYGLGDSVARIERVVGEVEHIVLIAAILCALSLMGWRVLHAIRARRDP